MALRWRAATAAAALDGWRSAAGAQAALRQRLVTALRRASNSLLAKAFRSWQDSVAVKQVRRPLRDVHLSQNIDLCVSHRHLIQPTSREPSLVCHMFRDIDSSLDGLFSYDTSRKLFPRALSAWPYCSACAGAPGSCTASGAAAVTRSPAACLDAVGTVRAPAALQAPGLPLT